MNEDERADAASRARAAVPLGAGDAGRRAADDGGRRAPGDPGRRAPGDSEPLAPLDAVFLAALACFFLSGFAALLYQTVWMRAFAFVFGTADLAVATVLAAYMAGLACGAAAAARFAVVVRRPLLTYAVLELVIALAAVLVPMAVRASTALAVLLFGSGAAPPSASGPLLAAFYLACGFVILLIPTACMGATLPLLARVSVRTEDELAARIGTLYAVNTAGAVVGTVVAAFVLLPAFGLFRTVLVGVAANVVVGALAGVVARAGGGSRASTRVFPTTVPARWSIVLPILLVSGITSFSYEVVWTRLLGHVLGGSTYAFATMLATFLAGIAIGAAVAARVATTAMRAARGLIVAELAIAAGSLAAFRAMDALPALALQLGAGRRPDQLGNLVLAALVMFPSTLAIGATFPFAVRVLAVGKDDAAVASARVYAWNTVGAIVGALGSGFFLMPWLGYAGLVAAAAGTNLGLALVLALCGERRAPWLAALAVAGGFALVALPPTTPWTLVGTSPLSIGRASSPPEFFAVGRSAAVAVGVENGLLKLRTNGLPEGVMLPPHRFRRAIPDRWLGALPALARPNAQHMLVVGLGAGTALEAVPRTLPDIDVIELEPRVIEANTLFRARRAIDPLALPGLHLHANDARGALNLTTKRYDIVVSQPSHPWTAGAAHLYTREFFHLVRDHLTSDGVFVQWIDLELVDQPLLTSLLATLLDAFPNVRVYRPFFRGTALFLASAAPLDVEANAVRALRASGDDFARAGVRTREDVAAALALDENGTRTLAADAPLTTDDWNLLETRTIRVQQPLGYRGADALFGPLDPLPGKLAELDRLALVRRLLADWDFPRADRVVAALGDPVERATAAGIVFLATERTAEGLTQLRAALALDPDAYEARVALLRAERLRLVAGDAKLGAIAATLGDPARAVIAGWQSESAGDWASVRALESRLALAAPTDAVADDALRLRAGWRIASGEPALAAEGLAILDGVLPTSLDPTDYVQRARAALVLGDAATAVESLEQAIDASTPGDYRRMAARVREVLATVPPVAEVSAARAGLEQKLELVTR